MIVNTAGHNDKSNVSNAANGVRLGEKKKGQEKKRKKKTNANGKENEYKDKGVKV